MDTPAASLAGYGYLMAAALYAALMCRLVLSGACGRQANTAALAYAGAIGATSLWGAFGFASRHWEGEVLPIIGSTFDLLRYAFWFTFALLLLRAGGARVLRRENRMLTVLASAVIAAGGVVLAADVTTLHSLEPSSLGGIGSYVGLAQAVTGLILVEQLLRNAADDSRWKLKPLCLGLACVFAFDFYLASEAVMFVRRAPEAMSVRGGVHAVAVPLLLLASSRGSDWLSDLRLSRVAAFRSTALLLTGTYLLFIAGIGYYVRYFGGNWGAALQIVFSFVALIVLVVLVSSGTVQAKLRVFLGKHFFSYRYDYREEWLKFTALLSSRTAPQEMGALVIRGLADMVESPGAALWTRSPGDAEFVRTARWNFSSLDVERLPVSAFTDHLRNHGSVVDLQSLRERGPTQEELEVPAWLAASENAWLVVPLIVGDDLSGLVVLARARTVVDVDWEVTELLATASRQAASFLAQMRATESLLETRKFDAFNRMSAFVVHDLKNIVTQLSLMLRNAKRLQGNPEFQRDMLETVESSLEKMRQLMLQLREGEAPAGVQSGVDLVAIAKRIEAVAAERGRRLEVESADRLMTRGHEDRIERVIGHVVQNAFDATDASGRVWLRLRRASGQARVEVGDTGHGMSPDFIRNRLFKPFNTTKSTGMGIGAYESFQYVKELGGSISVESQPDKGTVMTILMPLFESRQASDLQLHGEA